MKYFRDRRKQMDDKCFHLSALAFFRVSEEGPINPQNPLKSTSKTGISPGRSYGSIFRDISCILCLHE